VISPVIEEGVAEVDGPPRDVREIHVADHPARRNKRVKMSEQAIVWKSPGEREEHDGAEDKLADKHPIPPQDAAVTAGLQAGERLAAYARKRGGMKGVCAKYQAVDRQGRFGAWSEEAGVIIVHTRNGKDMPEILDGDVLDLLSIDGHTTGQVRVLHTGRAGYFAPGRKVSSLSVAVPIEEWERVVFKE
jgi:hypothetical protein